MRILLVTSALLASAASIGSAHQPRRPVVPFNLVLERTPRGWSAVCDSGCNWKAASFECATACNAIIDNLGVRTVLSSLPDSVTFSFRVRRTDAGWKADARSGTAWTELAWGCKTDPCRAQVDSYGVAGVATGR